jgi:protein SCO1/2/putative membrane protein
MKYLWVVFVLVGALAASALVGFFIRRGGRYERVPDFSLVERSGAPLTRKDLIGKVWVAEFIFTRCAGACPVMVSRMMGLYKKFPDVTYVSFTVDPANDTPEVLRGYVKNNSLPNEWVFGTGTYAQMQDLAKNGFKLSMGPGSSADEPIIHSDRLVIVDRYGRQRASCSTSNLEGMSQLEDELRRVLAEPAIPVLKLPAVNACLNAASGVFLILGLMMIKARKPGVHKAFMLMALASSSVFLVSYLTAHHFMGSTPYRGEGALRTVYFAILVTHSILAALIVPLALLTVYRAFQAERSAEAAGAPMSGDAFTGHRAIAKWTFPLWLYVSVTGVVIYFMLY